MSIRDLFMHPSRTIHLWRRRRAQMWRRREMAKRIERNLP
jgi:hypothetical protein